MTVPAGTFEDCWRFRADVACVEGLGPTRTWLAPGVGIVRYEFDGFDGKITEELIEFRPLGVFVRGDSNGSGTVELADAITALLWLFRAENRPNCMESSDTDANGVLNLADPIGLLRHLFIEGAGVPAPPCPACGQRYLYAFDC